MKSAQNHRLQHAEIEVGIGIAARDECCLVQGAVAGMLRQSRAHDLSCSVVIKKLIVGDELHLLALGDRYQGRQALGGIPVIGVQHREPSAPSQGDAGIHGSRLATVARQRDRAHARIDSRLRRGDLGCFVAGAIVDDQDFEIAKVLRQDGLNRARQRSRAVVGRHKNRNPAAWRHDVCTVCPPKLAR